VKTRIPFHVSNTHFWEHIFYTEILYLALHVFSNIILYTENYISRLKSHIPVASLRMDLQQREILQEWDAKFVDVDELAVIGVISSEEKESLRLSFGDLPLPLVEVLLESEGARVLRGVTPRESLFVPVHSTTLGQVPLDELDSLQTTALDAVLQLEDNHDSWSGRPFFHHMIFTVSERASIPMRSRSWSFLLPSRQQDVVAHNLWSSERLFNQVMIVCTLTKQLHSHTKQILLPTLEPESTDELLSLWAQEHVHAAFVEFSTYVSDRALSGPGSTISTFFEEWWPGFVKNFHYKNLAVSLGDIFKGTLNITQNRNNSIIIDFTLKKEKFL